MASSPASNSVTRPLDAVAAAIVVVLCLSWGFNQVAMKLAIHDIPPLMQATIRSVVAALLVAGWCRLRGIPMFARDGTLSAGLAAGVLFGAEFILIYQGLVYTTATRAVLFIYLAPFFVVLGARIFLPGRPLPPGAMARSRAVLRRHAGRLRPADAGGRSAASHRRPDDGRCRAVLGGDHADHQSERADTASRRKK